MVGNVCLTLARRLAIRAGWLPGGRGGRHRRRGRSEGHGRNSGVDTGSSQGLDGRPRHAAAARETAPGRVRHRRYTRPRWTCTSSGRSPRPRSGPRSTRSSDRPSPAGPAAGGDPRRGPRRARRARDPGAGATCCCRRCTPCRIGSAGSASRPSTTSRRRLAVPPAEAYGVATFYALFATKPRPPASPTSATTSPAGIAGAETICADLTRALGPAGEPARDGRSAGCASPCLGLCDLRAGRAVHGRRARRPIDGQPRADRRGGGPRAARGPTAPSAPPAASPAPRPQAGAAGELRLLAPGRRRRPDVARRLPRARRLRGARARARDRPRGRHRRGHRIEARWAAAAPRSRPAASGPPSPTQPAQPHYVVCNADESEPGTFKDRVLLEGDPFAVVEAMTIAGFATGAARGYLYIRGEYPLAEARIAAAHRRGARGRLPRRRRPRAPASPSTSSSGAAPAPTSAARRRRSSSRSRASAASRATSRRSRSRSGCSASRRSSTTSRRWPTSR